MVTTMSAVAVSPLASVAVTRNVAMYSLNVCRPVPVNAVVAELGDVAAICVAPSTRAQLNVYGAVPPAPAAVTLAVVCAAVYADFETAAGVIETVGAERVIVTLTSAVAVLAAPSVTVQRNTAVR